MGGSANPRASDVPGATYRARGERPADLVEWWRDAVIYQIYPRSFADSDGDGVGDLPGITARLDHLAWLGVDAVWLSPFYPSPQADGGYDVSDYCDVEPALGTLADADALVQRAHALGLRVIVDLVPNHSSDEHPWFRAALAAPPGAPERDLYMFRPGSGPDGSEPPNNWQSIFGGPAWSRVDHATRDPRDAGYWYLHTFDPKQPDLNWDSPVVRERFEEVLRFWLDRGIDGFRIDVAHGMVKAEGLPDWDDGRTAMVMGGSEHGPTPDVVDLGPMFDQEGVHDIYRSWNRLLATYPGDRVMVGEACVEPAERAARYVRPDEMQQAFNFPFLQCPWHAQALRQVITVSLEADSAVGAPTTWVLSNHDVVRHASLLGLADTGRSPGGIGADDPQPDAALGLRRARAAALLMLGLPGSAYLYQGEELGLPEHTTLPDDARRDPMWARSGGRIRGRDGCRVPLPWQAGAPGLGFSPTGRTWLPQPDGWSALAADTQRDDPTSTLTLYRTAVRLRRKLGLGSGSLRWERLDGADPDRVLAFGNGDTLVVVNLGDDPVRLPQEGEVVLSSEGVTDVAVDLLERDTAAWIRTTLPPVEMLTSDQIAEAALTDWRKLGQGLHARYVVADFATGARFVAAVGEACDALGHHPRVRLGDGYVDLELVSDDAVYRDDDGTEHVVEWVTRRDVEVARRVTEVAAQLALPADPASVTTIELALDTAHAATIAPVWAALLTGSVEARGRGTVGDDIRDATGRVPPLWFQATDEHETPRQRFHVDVWVPPEVAEERIAAAVAAGGVVVDDSQAPSYTVVADQEGNKACVCTTLPPAQDR